MPQSDSNEGLQPSLQPRQAGLASVPETAVAVDEPPSPHPGRPRWRTLLCLFLLLNCLFILASSGRVRVTDEVAAIYQVESLLDRGDTSVPQALESKLFYGKVDQLGKPRAPNLPLQAVLAVPWQIAGRGLARVPGVPEGARNLVRDCITVFSSATFAALAASLFFLLLRSAGTTERSAATITLLTALATPLVAYSAYFFPEPLAVALLLGAAWALFAEGGRGEIPARRAVLGGVALGLLPWLRPAHVVAAPLFILCVLASERKRCYVTAVIVAVLVGFFGMALLLRNDALFNDPFDFGYPPAAEGGKQLNAFSTPLGTGLRGFLLSPGKSLFLFAPPVLLALWGIPKLWRQNRDLTFVCTLTLPVYVLLYSTYAQWEGGYCVGPRYLLPPCLLLCAALGPALANSGPRLRRVALVLFVAGFLVQGISMATSFLEDQAGGAYYDAQWNYRLSYNPLVGQAKLLWKYATSPQPAALGLGFDRWFLYLHKGGVSGWLLAALLAASLTGAVLSGRALWKQIRE